MLCIKNLKSSDNAVKGEFTLYFLPHYFPGPFIFRGKSRVDGSTVISRVTRLSASRLEGTTTVLLLIVKLQDVKLSCRISQITQPQVLTYFIMGLSLPRSFSHNRNHSHKNKQFLQTTSAQFFFYFLIFFYQKKTTSA